MDARGGSPLTAVASLSFTQAPKRDIDTAVADTAVSSLWSAPGTAAREVGAGFVPYSPLGRGFLTGTMTKDAVAATVLRGQHRFDEHFDANQRVVDVLREVATERDATPAQVALAWLYAQGRRFGLPVVPIPGSRSPERMAQNAGALDVDLTAEDLSRLDAAADLVVGDRNLTFNGPEWISSGRE